MGQGLNLKIAQICAQSLGVPLSKVSIPSVSSDTLALAGFTAGSMGTDLYGAAVLNACQELNKRLAPLRESEAMKGKSWEDLIGAAIFGRVCLSAYGYFAPDMENRHFLYYTWGTACTEVELDVLTGAYTVISVDLVQDVGKSLNPAIDIGQCEGGFIQGMGWLTTEELRWNEHGQIDENYEIPMAENLPHRFNISLLKNPFPNPRTVFSSKGVGEPPKFMGVSVVLAIKDAIIAAREQAGLSSEDLILNYPLTVERARLACGDLNLAITATLQESIVDDDGKAKEAIQFEE